MEALDDWTRLIKPCACHSAKTGISNVFNSSKFLCMKFQEILCIWRTNYRWKKDRPNLWTVDKLYFLLSCMIIKSCMFISENVTHSVIKLYMKTLVENHISHIFRKWRPMELKVQKSTVQLNVEESCSFLIQYFIDYLFNE